MKTVSYTHLVGVVPVTRKAQALTDIVFGLIAQQRARTGDVRQGMAYVSRPEITVGRFGFRRFGLVADDLVTDCLLYTSHF